MTGARDLSADQLVSTFLSHIERGPRYARGLIGLAEMVADKKDKLGAYKLARQALEASRESHDVETESRARALLSSLIPAYHVGMMNDARRNPAWDRAIRRAVRPGMRVLEIGTGGGMLALMAARAGAEKVITCEVDPVTATLAREVCERNGYSSVIEVVASRSQDLFAGGYPEGERPADLLVCDIFDDSLIGFDPLPALADARRRLLAPGAPVIPAFGSLRMALANWDQYAVKCHAETAAGFDIKPFADMARPQVQFPIGDPGVSLCSAEMEAFRFDFALPEHPKEGRAEAVLVADRDGTVDGIAQWIRLELDSETILEARPEAGAQFFSAPRFWPFPESITVRRGDSIHVAAFYREKRIYLSRIAADAINL